MGIRIESKTSLSGSIKHNVAGGCQQDFLSNAYHLYVLDLVRDISIRLISGPFLLQIVPQLYHSVTLERVLILF